MKVLIVGGSGYVGSVLIPILKHQVTNYDLMNLQDVRDKDLIESFCEGKDAVIYLASMSNNDLCMKNPGLAQSINEDAFPAVVEASRKAGVKRFIYASSVAAYGSSEWVLTEEDLLSPTTIYGQGKACCEDYLKSSKIPYIITRSASVCGFSPNMRWDLTVNKMVHDALKDHTIKVNGGEQIRCHINIHDLCDFYALLLEAPLDLVQNQTFNVVEKNESVRETAYTVAFIVSGTGVEFGPPTDDRSYQVSGKKAFERLGWIPKLSYTDGVMEILHA